MLDAFARIGEFTSVLVLNVYIFLYFNVSIVFVCKLVLLDPETVLKTEKTFFTYSTRTVISHITNRHRFLDEQM